MFRKIYCLLWKDLILRRNHYIATSSEVLLPVLIVLLANLILPKHEVEIYKEAISFERFIDKNCVSRHGHYGNVLYEPSTPFTDALMTKAACYAGYKKTNVKAGKLSDNSSYFSIGVKFENLKENDEFPKNIKYTLFPTNKIWLHFLKLWRFSASSLPKYTIPSLYNVLELQRAIDVSYLHLKNISTIKIYLENTDFFDRNPRTFSGAVYLSLFVAFSLLVPPIVSRIVQEKATGSKELMLMMGVKRWQLWVAKFLDVILVLFVTLSGIILFLFVPLKEDSNYLIISPFLFWAVVMYGLISVIFFLFFMSCFFERPTLAVYITEITWAFSFIFGSVISNLVELPLFVKYLMFLFPHISLMEGVLILLNFNFYGKTVNFTERLSGKEDSFTLINVLIMMTVDIILYAILTWYLELVKPGKFGVPQPYNFCFKKCYWFPRKILNSYNNSCLNKSSNNFELVPPDLQVGVSLKNVSKIYKSLDKGVITAVDNVTLDFYDGEISALLGHNGAGKTTIFSMVTGLCYPTCGKIVINGYELGVNVEEARRNLGLCPQKDMLFGDFTTLQILKFYGAIKGLKMKEAEMEARDLITKLKLIHVRNTPTANLSGGQKRKVSLAIALIGGSKVLVLDEPTSGLDPEIRREIWEILLGYRGTRTILLTTHFMEEADALCDRIAIMDHGRIRCYGSPMYLKSKFGKGYVLSVVLFDMDKSNDVVDYVKGLVPSAKFKSQNIRTLCFEIPETEVGAFPDLFTGLDQKQSKNEITSYCISLSTLEDVFLRLRSGHEEQDEFDVTDSPHKKLNMPEESPVPKGSAKLCYLQIWALLEKKLILFQRSFKSFLLYSILPSLLVILMSFYGRKDNSVHTVDPSIQKYLNYSLELYPSSLVFYSNISDVYQKIILNDLIRNSGSKFQEVSNITDTVHDIFMDDFYTYAKKVILGIDFSPPDTHIHYNEDAVHVVPISLNLIHNFLLKYWYPNGSIQTSVDVSYANKDVFFFPLSAPSCRVEDLPDFIGSQTMFYLLGPMKERLSGAKELQLMIAPAVLYWLSHILFDVVSYILYIIVLYLGLGISMHDDFMLEHADDIIVGLVLCGVGLILLTYIISNSVKDIAAAFSINMIIYVVFTFVIYHAITLDGLSRFFQYLHPMCILKFGYAGLCTGENNHFLWALLLYNIVLFTFLVVTDSKIFSRFFHRITQPLVIVDYGKDETKDDLVKQEEEIVKKLVKKNNISTSALVASELKRWYLKGLKCCPAVRGISFAVNKGECFGLLGINGAGKTSTFKMLTGCIPPSHGSVYACSEQLSFFNRRKYLLSIGYCPQLGGLIPAFKGKELLAFFANLRGVQRSKVPGEVRKWLNKLSLTEYANQCCGTYSGGNQRKLSTAIALIGDCPLIFLDEPTSGVDPLSRRSIWSVIEHVQKEGQSVVLTSHSMDECEALCSRLAIMVNGTFRCIGETTTLKDRFGKGYYVQLKVSSGASEETVNSLKKQFVNAFKPACELVDEHLTILQYHVKNKSTCLANLFKKLNEFKEKFAILESYTASATTLEQIFIYFAKNQHEN